MRRAARPQVGQHPQLDGALAVALEQVADRRDVERHLLVGRHPVAVGVRPGREPATGEAVDEQLAAPASRSSQRLLDGVHTRAAVVAPRRSAGRAVVGPEGDARAVAREPEQRRVRVVDRPHHRRLVRVRRRHVRHEPLDGRVLAEVEEVRRVGLVPGSIGRPACQGLGPATEATTGRAPDDPAGAAPYGDSMQTVTLDDPLAALDVAAGVATDDGVWAPHRRRLTLGLVFTITLVAFEALAISTVMPVVADDLGGLGLYGWVFSGFFLGNLLGIVVAGQAADRRGTALPFLVGLVRVHRRA